MNTLCKCLIIYTVSFFAVSCGFQTKSQKEGVSFDLAQTRASNISQVEYSLFFYLPDSIGDVVDGIVDIKLSMKEVDDLTLDFKSSNPNLRNTRVNGELVELVVENEHISVAESLLLKGENTISMEFEAPNTSLNRRDEFLYTLLVPDRARTLFPCFDQPNIKAKYSLELDIPGNWDAVANGSVSDVNATQNSPGTYGRKRIRFNQTRPISTYLFSFVAGVFQKTPFTQGKHSINIFHRATTDEHLTQLPDIADEVFKSLEWCEKYTQIDYPFEKYDLVILPGFQYGGMEHMGATLYNDTKMFLPKSATLDQIMARSSLIAHETTHMWFGDLVTMKWFNEVWLKEVFANYYAAEIIKGWYPGLDQKEAFIKYFTSAYYEDRTLGAVPVIQELDNLNNAGLVYGTTIYNKTPIVMQMLVDMIGKEAFDKGIRKYLSTYAYSNADWTDLIEILTEGTDIDLKQWSKVWVETPGMPTIKYKVEGDELIVTQSDPQNRGICWPQTISFIAIGEGFRKEVLVEMQNEKGAQVRIPTGSEYLLPNHNMKAYGYFQLDTKHLQLYKEELLNTEDPILKHSILTNLYENVLNQNIEHKDYAEILRAYIENKESGDLLYNRVLRGLSYCLNSILLNDYYKYRVCDLLSEIDNNSAATRIFISSAYGEEAQAGVLDLLTDNQKYSKLSDPMKNTLIYHLAIYYPERAVEFLNKRRSEISNPDKLEQFNFISQAVARDLLDRERFFYSLLDAENRAVEPWAESALALLNHPSRQEEALKFILPGLEVLLEIHQTGDIFFPAGWASSLLSGHSSAEANKIVNDFIETCDFEPLLLSKVLQASDQLRRINK